MKMSVLINNYNYSRYLSHCIDSVVSQEYDDKEIIVVDDGSTDGSGDVIKRYGSAIVPVWKENGGQASCFNTGFAQSTGDIILLLDADDAFLPGKLSVVARLYGGSDATWCFDPVTKEEDGRIRETPVPASSVDLRPLVRRGHFPKLPGPTSGLTFRRDLLAEILPMPTAQGVVLSDNYVKFAAAYLGPGIIVHHPLSFQRIHGSNRYTDAAAKRSLRAAIMSETGYWLAKRYPGMRGMAVHLLAKGLADRGLSPRELWAEITQRTAHGEFGRAGRWRVAAHTAAKYAKAVLHSEDRSNDPGRARIGNAATKQVAGARTSSE
jgi:glycosyltransferase involved in cell wall biosynthesis